MQSSFVEMLIEDLCRDRSDFTSFAVRGFQIVLIARMLLQNSIKVMWHFFGNLRLLCLSKGMPRCSSSLYACNILCNDCCCTFYIYNERSARQSLAK